MCVGGGVIRSTVVGCTGLVTLGFVQQQSGKLLLAYTGLVTLGTSVAAIGNTSADLN